ncbi:hypothetical protein [Nocardia salmonicida]|uniref:hypothetical protein n=1 Tax=Nocardia salmonicida TaxID=53431 RepID=UPI0033DD27E8
MHIVVEGKRYDSSYYGKISESSVTFTGNYLVSKIQKIYTGGGKSGILKVYDSLKRSGHLVQHTSTGRKVVAFMLDRDAELVLGGSKRHPHVFYTYGYDVESDILRNGSDTDALAIALSLSPADARVLAKKLGNWRRDAAILWKEWIVLCCIATKLSIGCRANFSRSVVSNDDLTDIPSVRSQLISMSGLSTEDFYALESSISTKVEKFYDKNQGDRLMKGKWLPRYLSTRIEACYSKDDEPDLKDFEHRLVASYLASMPPSGGWDDQYLRGWEALIGSSS